MKCGDRGAVPGGGAKNPRQDEEKPLGDCEEQGDMLSTQPSSAPQESNPLTPDLILYVLTFGLLLLLGSFVASTYIVAFALVCFVFMIFGIAWKWRRWSAGVRNPSHPEAHQSPEKPTSLAPMISQTHCLTHVGFGINTKWERGPAVRAFFSTELPQVVM